MSDRLDEIKEKHEKANQLWFNGRVEQTEECMKIVNQLFLAEHTDYLISRAEKAEQLEAENERLRAALEFYANRPGGKVAEKALKGSGENERIEEEARYGKKTDNQR